MTILDNKYNTIENKGFSYLPTNNPQNALYTMHKRI